MPAGARVGEGGEALTGLLAGSAIREGTKER